MISREARRPAVGEEDVPAIAHDGEGQVDRMADVSQAGHPAGPQLGALHDPGVKLDLAVAVQACSDSGVEKGLVLHVAHRRHDRGKGPAPDRGPACVTGALDRRLAKRALIVGDGSGSAVDDESRSSRGLTQ
jgi:hypothetical protein